MNFFIFFYYGSINFIKENITKYCSVAPPAKIRDIRSQNNVIEIIYLIEEVRTKSKKQKKKDGRKIPIEFYNYSIEEVKNKSKK